jgi:hypothetical protein
MSTIVIHGTLANQGPWWRHARPGGFLDALAQGMREGGREPDVWLVGGHDVRECPNLSGQGHRLFQTDEGRFMWSGQNHHPLRIEEGKKLARYLEALALLSHKPINIVAHSHGCNLVKVATNFVASSVSLGPVVFLAAPHCETGPPTKREYLYRLNDRPWCDETPYRPHHPPVLNLYSQEDTVQKDWAGAGLDTLGLPPALPGLTPMIDACRVDTDPGTAGMYDNLEVPTRLGKGPHVHYAMHGPTVGRIAGLWLARWPELSGQQCLEYFGVKVLTDKDAG